MSYVKKKTNKTHTHTHTIIENNLDKHIEQIVL